jgi:hypothetical protein
LSTPPFFDLLFSPKKAPSNAQTDTLSSYRHCSTVQFSCASVPSPLSARSDSFSSPTYLLLAVIAAQIYGSAYNSEMSTRLSNSLTVGTILGQVSIGAFFQSHLLFCSFPDRFFLQASFATLLEGRLVS